MVVTGWYSPPRYDSITHTLEWAINGENKGERVVNYQARVLGRGGVMHVMLVGERSKLHANLPEYRTLLSGFDYKPGSNALNIGKATKWLRMGSLLL